ncbi:MAG: polysaccharide deacetylase family protein [Burkholderiales bacterium]
MLRSHDRFNFSPIVDRPVYDWPRDWGNRVGIWRLLELLDAYDIPCAANLNTEIYESCPQIARALRARGDEIVGHGRTNAERQAEMSEEDETRMIREVTERIAREEGRAPLGWMGPWVNETLVTPDLLHEAGYLYVMDWARTTISRRGFAHGTTGGCCRCRMRVRRTTFR